MIAVGRFIQARRRSLEPLARGTSSFSKVLRNQHYSAILCTFASLDQSMGVRELVVMGAMVCALMLIRFLRRERARPTSVDSQTIEVFQRRKRRQFLLCVPVVLLWFFLYRERTHPSGMSEVACFSLAMAVLAGACLFTYYNWRCPKCAGYLGKYAWQSGLCPKCGTALREPRDPKL